MKFKKNDQIIVTSGRDRGKTGKIDRLVGGEAIIPEINVSIRHVKPQEGRKGGRISVSKPLNPGKFMLVCPKCSKPTRVGWIQEKGEKYRICRKCKSTF